MESLQFVKAKHFQLLGYQLELTNDLAPYGSLEYGRLMIRCRLKRCKWVQHQGKGMSRWDRLEIYSATLKDDITDESTVPKRMPPQFSQISCHFDAIEDEFDDENITSIPVCLLEGRSWDEPNGTLLPQTQKSSEGLILRKLGDSQFSRLGISRFFTKHRREETDEEFEQRKEFQSHWFDDCEPQIIALV
jgi:hypothetical protein